MIIFDYTACPICGQHHGTACRSASSDVNAILSKENAELRAENERLRDALLHAQGFLKNQGYTESDPLVLGMINKALNAEQGGE